MLVIAVIQGVLLFALYRAFETDSWPSESPLWSYPLWTLAATHSVRKMSARELGISDDLWAKMLYRPEPFDVPAGLQNLIDASYIGIDQGDPVMVRADLDNDGQNEYLLLLLQVHGIGYSQFYYLSDAGWRAGNLGHSAWRHDAGDIKELISGGDIELVDPRFSHLEIGGVLLKPYAVD